MENENRCPTLESLLQNMIANQQSMHETFEEFNDRLKRIEEKIESLDDYQTMEVEEEEDSSDGKNTYRPSVKIALMKR